MTKLVQFDFDSVQQQLSENDLSNFDWQLYSRQMKDFAEAAVMENHSELADCALILSQLFDLADMSHDQELRHSLAAFIADKINNLDPQQEVSEVVAATSETRNHWQEYLECLGVSSLPVVDDWNEESFSPEDNDSSEQVDEPCPQQLDLLLSAVKYSAAEAETIPEPTETIPNDVVESRSPQPTAPDKQNPDEISELLQDEDMREAFMDDAGRGLDVMEKCSLSVEQNPSDNEPVTQFCRELHTLKGASASVGLSQLAADIHEAENALTRELTNEQTVELMLGIVDKVRKVIHRLNPGAGDIGVPADPSTGPRELSESLGFSSGNDDSLIRIRASKLDRLMDMLAELVVLRNRRECHISELSEFNDELRRCSDRLSYYAQDPTRDDGSSFNSSLTLSELSKDISDLSSGIRQLQNPINKDNLAISHFIRDFRHELMQLRRTPVAALFNRVQRSARDAAKSEGKKLRLEVAGEDAGLERELQEKLFEPLLHIVRNAVSHGIESPQIRQQQGKDPIGLVSLTAQSNSQMVMISIEDDGAGLDYEAIRHRGMENGLIKPNQFLNENELGKLIFHPGFSTRDAASEVSGRGVGMDVVMTTIQQMRGRIEIESRPSEGTSMTIIIPVRSGIEHVMVVRAGNQLFALPMQAVTQVKSIHVNDENTVHIASLLGMQGAHSTRSSDVLILRGHDKGRNDQKFGFVVDEILGPEEVVIRKLPSLLQPHPLFCGLTLSGAGETALLLDADRLAKFNRNINSVDQRIENDSGDAARSNVLVIDDSMSARKLLSKKLLAMGMNVAEAADGIEGLEQIRNNSFDLVFTDLDMPRMGGLELLFDLQQGRHREQKVVVVSSRAADEFCDRALEMGAVAYLTKPVEDNELVELLQHLQILD